MEDAFFALYQEFRELQAVCSKQAELLQQLLSKKALDAEMPISKPIQCTDVGYRTCSERPLLMLKGTEVSDAETSTTVADEVSAPSGTNEKSSLFDFDVQFFPNKDQYSAAGKGVAANDLLHADHNVDKRGINSNLALFIKNYTPTFPNLDGVGVKIPPVISHIDFLTPVDGDHDLSLSNIYEEDLSFLQSKDISLGELLGTQNKNVNAVRGPAQPTWSPGCLSEEGQPGQCVDSDVSLSSQICEFCQAIFPAGAATKGEFLGHLTGHME
ncbi:TRAF family member-associated NF-kappa-B activator-like [Pseudophryne corroboree]|uniref:TRAF family member-associated NF-kappa-B activator-like n=1 Tax=Pseudophryne corroboree TaxID=495146 RepID=UPI0030820849